MGRTLAGTTVELVHTPDGVLVNNIPLVADVRIARGTHKVCRLASGGLLAGPLARSDAAKPGIASGRGMATMSGLE